MPNATPQRQLLKSIVQLFILQPTKNTYYSFWEYPNKLLEILQFTMYLSMWCELQAKFMNGCLDDKGLKGTNNQRKSVVNEMCEGLEQVPCPILPSFSNSSYSTYIGYKFDESLQRGRLTYNHQGRGAQNGAFQWKLSGSIQPIASSFSHHAQFNCSYEQSILEHTTWS